MTAGAHLHPQGAIAFEPRGQSAAETERREAIGQHARQQFFARIAGHVEAQACDEAHGNLVAYQPVDLYFHRRGLLGGAPFAEPDRAVGTLGLRDPLPVDDEINDGRRHRQRQRFRARAPLEAPRDRVAARRQAQVRHVADRHHRGRLTVDPDLARPVFGIARQRDPAVREHLPALREAAAARVDAQRESFGPAATKRAGVDGLSGLQVRGGEEWTTTEFLAAQYPSLPVLQGLRHRLLRLRIHGTADHERGKRRANKHAHLDALEPSLAGVYQRCGPGHWSSIQNDAHGQ